MRPRRSGLTLGCALLLVPVVLALLVVTATVLSFVWSVVDLNRHRDDFAAFDHIDAGSSAKAVIERAEELGFDEEPMSRSVSDAGVESRHFMKTVLPPFGRWFVHVESFDGGVVRVRTSTLD